METIFRKVSIKERLPEKNKFVPTIDENGEIIINRLTDIGWNMRDGISMNSPINNLSITHWLEEIKSPYIKEGENKEPACLSSIPDDGILNEYGDRFEWAKTQKKDITIDQIKIADLQC